MEENLTEILDNAYNLHISGKLDEAKQLYEKLLSIDSENIETLNLYAQLLVSLKDFDAALSIFNKIYDKTQLNDIKINIAKIFFYKSDFNEVINILKPLNDNSLQVLSLLSSSYVKLNDYENAYKTFKSIYDINKTFDNIYNVAFCLGNLHRYEEAYEYAHEAYLLNNSDYPVIMQCAQFSEELGNYDKAIEYLTEAGKISHSPELFNKLGSLYSQSGKQSEALECYKRAISIDPKNKQAMLNIAFLYKTIDKNIAINIFNELLYDYPDDKLIISSLYYMYFNIMDFDNALQTGLYYIAKHPDDYFAYIIAGEAYSELFDFENASNMFKKASELSKDEKCFASYGDSLYKAGHFEEGKKILESFPDCENARTNLTTIYLREKEFKKCEDMFLIWHTDILPEKVAEDKARRFFYKLNLNNIYNVNEDMFVKNVKNSKEVYSAEKFNNLLKKVWRRENIKDKTLLLFSHNGAGDLIMFSRYIPMLKELCKKLIIYVPDSFLSIMKYNFPDIEIHSKNDDIPENLYDYSATFFTILYSIDIDLNNIPYSEGYLKVDNKLVEEKSKSDILKTDKKKVGIYWQGNPTILRNRSIQLKYFEPLFQLNNIQLYSFQMSDIDKESDLLKKEKPIIDLAPLIDSYEDSAAFLKNMDVLVTIDTSIANLAGALGVKTFLLLPKTSEWRWFFDKDKTPWYDSVKIFKAEKDLVWDDVMKRLEEELSK